MQYLKWLSVFIIADTRDSKPYGMQSMAQSPFSTLALDKILQNLKLLCATWLDSTRIVKNVTRMIEEHEFVVDTVVSPLAVQHHV